MNAISTLELYDLLKVKVGEREAKALVEYVDNKVEQRIEEKKDILATKQDIHELSEKLIERMDTHFKWLIGLFIGQMGFIFGIVYFILTFKK